MGGLTGAVLPLAMGVALSPVPAAVMVLLLAGARGLRRAAAFAVGWVLGVGGTLAALLALGATTRSADRDGGAVGAAFQVSLGVVLVVLALRRWRAGTTDPSVRSPAALIDSEGRLGPLLLGASMTVLNPKNFGVTVAVADLLAAAWPDGVALPVLGFLLVGSVPVVAPFLLRLAAPAASARLLHALRARLDRHGSAITVVVLLVVGAVLIGLGLASW